MYHVEWEPGREEHDEVNSAVRHTRLSRRVRTARRGLWGLVILAAASLLVGGVGKLALGRGWFDGIDAWAPAGASPEAAVRIAQALAELGTMRGLTVATAVMVVVLLVRRQAWPSLILFGAAVTSTAARIALQSWTGRTVPGGVPPAGTFPSAHAFAALAVYGLFAYFFVRSLRAVRVKIAAVLLFAAAVACLAYTPVVLGTQHVSDVLAGLILGVVWLVTGAWVAGTPRRERGLRFGY